MNARIEGVRVFANTNLAGRAAAGGFDGLYTYDVLLFDGGLFPRLCQPGAAPAPPVRAVGRPGLRRPARDRRPARQAATRRRALRRDVARRPARRAPTSSRSRATTSGTRAPRSSRLARDRSGYESYEGAWGLHGRAAETAYLDRTAFWVQPPHARLTTSAEQLETSASSTSPGSTPRSDSCPRSTSISGHDSSPSERAPSSAPKQSRRSVEKTPRLPV